MLQAIRHHARIYAKLQLLHVRAHLEYEADFWIGLVGSTLTQLAGFVFVWSLFSRVPEVAGWTLWEVAFLYGLATIPRGALSVLCDGPWRLRQLVYGGEFDRVLVRPISPALQVVCYSTSLHGLGVVALGFTILHRTSSELHLQWDLPRLAFLAVTLASAIVLYGAINFATNCIAFWEPGTTSAFPYLMAQMMEFARYPVTLYSRFVQVVVTWVLPVAFTSYYPSLVLLNRPLDPAWMAALTPVAALTMVLMAWLVWSCGLVRYQGTGH